MLLTRRRWSCDNLQAGPELDALIAEKVFGWVWEPTRGNQRYPWKVSDGVRAEHTPAFSSNIEFAWKVAEKMTREGWDWLVAHDEVWFQTSHLSQDDPNFKAGCAIPKSFEEIPFAICRAALKAVTDKTE